MQRLKIGIACGGTGGHILPGIACGTVLQERGHTVDLWLAGREVEGVSTGGWTGGVVSVPSAGFQREGISRTAAVCCRMAMAVMRAIVLMRRHRPDVMVAMGSYASVSPVVAAWLRHVPIVLHEANAVPGRAIQMLAPLARTVALAFPDAAAHIRCKRSVVTGLPLRRWVGDAAPLETLSPDNFTLLVMGGSQGAHRLNEVASDAICRLQAVEPVQVIHLAGGRDAAGIENRYAERGVSARVFPFLAEMDRAYAMSNLAITRAGAATCFELAAFGVPALLVPLPTASRNHQQANAEAMSREGCAEVVDEAGLTGEKLAAYISDMRRRPEKRASMQRAMRKVAAPESAPALADLVEAVAALR